MSDKKWNEHEERWETPFDTKPYQVDDTRWSSLDLAKFLGKGGIKRIEGSLTGQLEGQFVFGVHRIVFDDDTWMHIEGTHDLAYVWGSNYPVDMDALAYDEETDDLIVVEYGNAPE